MTRDNCEEGCGGVFCGDLSSPSMLIYAIKTYHYLNQDKCLISIMFVHFEMIVLQIKARCQQRADPISTILEAKTPATQHLQM